MDNVNISLGMKKGLMTVKGAATLLNVSTQTVRRWDRQGKLKATRHPLNNYRIYKLVELKELAKKLE